MEKLLIVEWNTGGRISRSSEVGALEDLRKTTKNLHEVAKSEVNPGH